MQQWHAYNNATCRSQHTYTHAATTHMQQQHMCSNAACHGQHPCSNEIYVAMLAAAYAVITNMQQQQRACSNNTYAATCMKHTIAYMP